MVWPKKAIPAATTPSQFAGDYLNRVSDLLSDVDIAVSDITLIPSINTNFRFRNGRLKLRNPANTFEYTFITNAITSNLNVSLPLLTSADLFVMQDHIQVINGKTVDLTNNSIIQSGAALGGLMKNNGTKFVNFARGIDGQLLKSSATDLQWGLVDDASISAHTTTKITITNRAQLPSPIAFEDEANTFSAINTFSSSPKFDTYYDIKAISEPASPAAGYLRGFADSGDGKYYIKKSDGTKIDLEAIAGVSSDDKVIVRESGTIVGGGSHKLNFPVATDFDITEDAGNDETDIKIADSAITNAHIAAHTSDKITITDHAHLPLDIMYEDMDTSFGAHYADIAEIAVPANPGSGVLRIFNDIATSELSVLDSTGLVTSLQTGGTGGTGNAGLPGGVSVQSGNASTLIYNIPHGLGVVPDTYGADASSSGAMGNFQVTADATNIIVTYTVAPASGTNNLTWVWFASMNPPVAVTGFTPSSANTITNKVYQNDYHSTYIDIERQGSDPSTPSANRARYSMKTIDANNDGIIVQIKQSNAFQKVRVV